MKKIVLIGLALVIIVSIGLIAANSSDIKRSIIFSLNAKRAEKKCPEGFMRTANWEINALDDGECRKYPPLCDTCQTEYQCAKCGDGHCQNELFETVCNCPEDCEMTEEIFCKSFNRFIDCPDDRCQLKLEGDERGCVPK